MPSSVPSTKAAHLRTPLYWFLISKGYKTYLLLSRNFQDYWPRHDAATPDFERTLIDALARDKFGEAWDADAGILRMGGRDGKLKHGVAPVDRAALTQADIRFFVTKNQGYVDGDELACIGLVYIEFAVAYTKKRLSRMLRSKPADRTWASETA